jgi:hypothetical protein
MAKVRYLGPSGAVNRDVGAESGRGDVMHYRAEYEVSEQLAKRLVASSADWKVIEDEPEPEASKATEADKPVAKAAEKKGGGS